MKALALKQASDGVMVALYPDRTVAEALAIPGGEPAEELHVTLAYLGSASDMDADALAALPHVIAQFSQHRTSLAGEVSGVGRFTATEDAHPFWASVDVPGLELLREDLVARLRESGYDVSADHGFTPHMTLAYLAAADPDPIETVHPHALRFAAVSLAVAGTRRDFAVFDADDTGSDAAELGGPIVAKNARQQIVYGAVLVPGEPDSDGEVLSAAKVEEVAHEWLAEFGLIDRQHSVKAIDAQPVESYITPQAQTVTVDGRTVELPAGTWIMAAKVSDQAVWAEIEAGTRTGFSIMGVPRARLEQAAAAASKSDGFPFRRVTLATVGGGDPNGPWVAPFVSIVDRPAVGKARFFAMKAEKNTSFLGWLRAALTRTGSGNPAPAGLSIKARAHLASMPSLSRFGQSPRR